MLLCGLGGEFEELDGCGGVLNLLVEEQYGEHGVIVEFGECEAVIEGLSVCFLLHGISPFALSWLYALMVRNDWNGTRKEMVREVRAVWMGDEPKRVLETRNSEVAMA